MEIPDKFKSTFKTALDHESGCQMGSFGKTISDQKSHESLPLTCNQINNPCVKNRKVKIECLSDLLVQKYRHSSVQLLSLLCLMRESL
jgi:hypothetical protein